MPLAPSRRTLLQGLATGTVATALGSPVFARQATPVAGGAGNADVIVIGAGLAGMGAGQALKLRGVPAIVLEARNRIGGRCYCDNSFPAPFDFGGQFFQQVVPNALGGTNNPLFDMYRAQGGPDVSCVLSPSFVANGQVLPDAEQSPFQDTATAVAAAVAAAGVAAQLGAPDISATDATAVLVDLPWYTMTTAFLALGLDAPADRLSSLDVWNDLQFAINPDGSPSDKVNPTGMGNFAAQFAEGLDIRLATPVTAIDLTAADRITVMTEQGPLTARAVIVTAPMTVLAAGKITFTPELPTEYQQAFADLPFGLVDKLGIAFSRDVLGSTLANTVITRHLDADLDAFATALTRLANQPMMNLFFADDLAHELEAGGTAAQEAFAREFLTDTYGSDAAQAIERTIIHPWGTDPWTMGSYSAARIGKVAARATLAQPIDDRLYFAGEAVSTYAHSSLHGAYLTGQNAALQIVDRLTAATAG